MNSYRIYRVAVAAVVAAVLPATVAADDGGDKPHRELARYESRVEEAIDHGLEYLAEQQKEDGSWAAPHLEGNTGIVSLGVMAFLASGYTPGTGPYGDVIDRGIDFILDNAQENGMLLGTATSHGPMYSHSISTLMLTEVSGMVIDRQRQQRIDEVLPKAIGLLLSAQQVRKREDHQGGWRYQTDSTDSDISCSGWAMMALRSARINGAPVPAESIEQAVRFVLNCRHPSGGFLYMPGSPGSPGLARTGTGLLCLKMGGRRGDEACAAAGDWILQNLPDTFGGLWFYYAIYHCSQGMFQLGGDYWVQWAEHMYDLVLPNQRDDGSWPTTTGGEQRAGANYATAMAVLSLSVPLRQLPIYQR